MKILVAGLGVDSLGAVQSALADQGYELLLEETAILSQIEQLAPEVLVTEASPTDLTCCAVITQLKARESTKVIRVLVVVKGGALERARALDLGADDVLSFPFEPLEFAARVRTQFRERQPEEELRGKLKVAEQKEHLAEIAMDSLSGGTVTGKRLWILPTVVGMAVLAVIATVVTSIAFRKNTKETRQLKAEVARLSTGIGRQGDILQQAQKERAALLAGGGTDPANRAALEAQSRSLREKMASAGSADADNIRKELAKTQDRLNRLESDRKIAETIVSKSGSSVCLLHVVVEFLDRSSGKPILVAVDGLGKPIQDAKGMVQLATEGNGPHLQLDIFGTGFLVRKDGQLVTNHHVAEPWWGNDELKKLIEGGASAYALSYTAYFPGSSEGIRAKVERISTEADVATLRLEGTAPAGTLVLSLDDKASSSVSGEPVVLIGYPTGIEGILARAGSDVAERIAGNATNVSQIVAKLAAEKLIRPTTTQGHIGDVLQDKIVYDAATTSGGSGGPLFDHNGKVIGVNFAILNGFGGSNLAVPARYAQQLFK
ncbi:MAG TPA: trypsin-like peptidase domain-containing protein [Candidatus Saccharimonadales bacterium]|nr:trypsin-like peptidase domain-containing protein [Candidatus Saccharimonadales bacterium]